MTDSTQETQPGAGGRDTSPGAGRSRIAATALQIASFGALSVIVGLLGIQIGLFPPMLGFMLFGLGTLLCGTLGMVLGGIAVFRTRSGFPIADQRRSIFATGLGIVLVLVVLGAGSTGGDAPPINDITTNLSDPPAFASAAEVPAYAGRDMSYPKSFVEIVKDAYPDLEPIRSSLAADDAYARAVAAARDLGWEIVHEDPAAGRFDATDTSRVFRFVDDVTVRVVSTASGSQLDVRSKSRDGRSDLGANAARIRAFTSELALPAVAADGASGD